MRNDGYRQTGYPRSLREFGTPRALGASGGWLLERKVPGQAAQDAIGCYPILACRDWSGLAADLEALRDEIVCVSFVTDPFGDFDCESLAASLDFLRPFKDHLVLDLNLDPEKVVTKHHRYYARRALKSVEVEILTRPIERAEEWIGLYQHLVERHQIDGVRAFSPASFHQQLQLDGMVMLLARADDEVVAGHLWILQDDVAYSHLAASSPRGYALSASYALYYGAIRHFAAQARWMNFGAGAGSAATANDGLTRFKRGWSNGSRTAYFCGRILQPSFYAELSAGRETDFFPAYRDSL